MRRSAAEHEGLAPSPQTYPTGGPFREKSAGNHPAISLSILGPPREDYSMFRLQEIR